jgi:hypothetical protein
MLKRPNYRKFDYQPRHYNPLHDEEERRKRRLGFTINRKHRTNRRSMLIPAVVLFIILAIYLKLVGVW